MRASREPGYVLHSRPYRETSLLIDLFTRAHGRVTVLAKGVRSLKSRQRSAMTAFSLLSLGWTGKGELPVLTQAEHEGPVRMLTGRARLCGFYANELVMKLLHRYDPHAELFDAYHDLLEEISHENNLKVEAGLRLFEKRLLKEIGYALDLEREADGVTRVECGVGYQYVPMLGIVKASQDSPSLTISGESLLALAQERLSEEPVLLECKRLMRGILAHHLGPHTLCSRTLFKIY